MKKKTYKLKWTKELGGFLLRDCNIPTGYAIQPDKDFPATIGKLYYKSKQITESVPITHAKQQGVDAVLRGYIFTWRSEETPGRRTQCNLFNKGEYTGYNLRLAGIGENCYVYHQEEYVSGLISITDAKAIAEAKVLRDLELDPGTTIPQPIEEDTRTYSDVVDAAPLRITEEPPVDHRITTPALLEAFHAEMTQKARDIVMKKNSDYANTEVSKDIFRSFRKRGLKGILTRLDDKMSRIDVFVEKALAGQKMAVTSESCEDTVLDAINYLILFAGYIRTHGVE